MEKILNEDEKIRRAEAMYYRRNNIDFATEENKRKSYFGSKILLNILMLLNIAVVIFCIQNKNYIFTKEFLEKCNEYNINLSEKMNGLVGNFLDEENVIEDFEKTNNVTENNIEPNVVEEIRESENVSEKTVIEESSSISEMDLDIENLKKIYKFVNPLKGTVSSGFGARESEYQNVTGYHTGIDIAAEKGTSIKSAMQGIVTLVSSKGDYRKTCKN